jgi:DNA-binding transcriptional ArsR family regulator
MKAGQRRALLALASEPGGVLTRAVYERLNGVGRSQAASELSELVSAGLLVRVGRGRSVRYELAPDTGADPAEVPPRRRLAWAAFVGVAVLAVFGAAALRLPLMATHGFASKVRRAAAPAAVEPRTPHWIVAAPSHPRRAAPPAVAVRHVVAHAPKREQVVRPATRTAPPVHAYAQQPTYVSNVVTKAATPTASSTGQASAPVTPDNSGPTPLRAPAGASPPQPLRSP